MKSVRKVLVLFIICIFAISATGHGLGLTNTAPTVKAVDRIDTPSKTFTVSGKSYTVSSIGHVDHGDPLKFQVSTNNASIFTIHLYNSEKQIVDSIRRQDDGTYSFETGWLSSGTYMLALSIDGKIESLYPVVISGYDIETVSPGEITENTRFNVNVSVSGEATPSRVDVVVMNSSWQKTYEAAKLSSGEYQVTIPADLAVGSYSIYVGARGEDMVDGRRELTGISTKQSIEVLAASTKTPTEASTDEPTRTTVQTVRSNTSTGSDKQTATEISTDNLTATGTTVSSDSGEKTSTKSPETPAPSDTVASTSETRVTDSRSTSSSGENVIKPASTTELPTETTSPGFTVLTVVFGLLIVLLATNSIFW